MAAKWAMPYPLEKMFEHLELGIARGFQTVRFWWNRFGPMSAAEIRKRRVDRQSYSNWHWHLDEVFVSIIGDRPRLCDASSRQARFTH